MKVQLTDEEAKLVLADLDKTATAKLAHVRARISKGLTASKSGEMLTVDELQALIWEAGHYGCNHRTQSHQDRLSAGAKKLKAILARLQLQRGAADA